MGQGVATTIPREGMLAIVRNRRAIVTGVEPYPPEPGPEGRIHLVHLDYTDADGVPTDTLVWEREPGARLLEATTLPNVADEPPMIPREFDALVRASRWTALTPTLPFTGLDDDAPPIASPLFGAVQVEDYQLVPLLRALRMPRVAILLADAVGLGKTIECGLILKELMLRRRLRRVLILCPAALRRQWKQEMADKFSLDFEIVDRKETQAVQRRLGLDANPWRVHEKLITSFQYLRQPDVLEQFRSAAVPGERGQLAWDLLIVDEAHNLAPSHFGADSELARMLRTIGPWFEHRLFLTATPHNGHTRCFTGLLEALDPVRFSRKSELTPDEKRRVEQVVVRRLKREINDRTDPPRFAERHVKPMADLVLSAPERNLVDAFSVFRQAVHRHVAEAARAEQIAGAFAVEVLGKRLLSGPVTFAQSWWRCIDGLGLDEAATAIEVRDARFAADAELDDDAELESRSAVAAQVIGAWLKPLAIPLAAEIRVVGQALEGLALPREVRLGADGLMLVGKATAPGFDARFDALLAWVDAHLRADDGWRADERLIVFTEYKTTLDYLAARLQRTFGDRDGSAIRVLFGGMGDDERQAIKDAFNDPDDTVRILVATDAASEGLNLQETSRYLLHWDIPWNPGRMEQRNGRLDRHGQARDVTIYHFTSSDDVSLRFMGKLLQKRSQIREDRISADQLFGDAIEAHFLAAKDANLVEEDLERAIANAPSTIDLPEAPTETGEAQKLELDRLAVALDLSPGTLRDTLEVALGGEGRLEGPDARGRFKLASPVPQTWRALVDDSLRRGGALPGLTFDPARFVRQLAGRPIFRPDKDSALIHLGHPLVQRAIATFARARFGGDPSRRASRWTVRQCPLPADMEAVVVMTIEELAVNELREPCHHWLRDLCFAVRRGKLEAYDGPPLEKTTAEPLGADVTEVAREVFDTIDRALIGILEREAAHLSSALQGRLAAAGRHALETEKARFRNRLAEISRSLNENTLVKLQRERDELLADLQLKTSFLASVQGEREKKLQDLNAELALRKSHYEELYAQLEEERERMIVGVLPLRYQLREGLQVFPVAVEIRLPKQRS